METSITSKMVSQPTICGDPESLNLETTNDTEPKLKQSKDQMEIEQTQKNLMKAREVYFKYFSSQRMAHTKSSIQQRVMEDGTVLVPPQSLGQPSTQSQSKNNQGCFELGRQ